MRFILICTYKLKLRPSEFCIYSQALDQTRFSFTLNCDFFLNCWRNISEVKFDSGDFRADTFSANS